MLEAEAKVKVKVEEKRVLRSCSAEVLQLERKDARGWRQQANSKQ
jgi:hypothetical protein